MSARFPTTRFSRTSRVRPRTIVLAGAAIVAGSLLAGCGVGATGPSVDQLLANGIAAQRAGSYSIAAKDYQRAIKLQPKNVDAIYDLADVQQFEGKLSSAETGYAEVLSLSPDFENAMYNLALIEAKSDPAAARALDEKVVAMSPKDGPAHLNYGLVLRSLGEKQAAKAQFAIAVHLDPSLKSKVPAN